jgi:MFS family permease
MDESNSCPPKPALGGGRHLGARVTAVIAIFAAIFASNAPTPLYAVWQVQWGFSSTALTAVFSVYVLGVVLTLPTVGPLSDLIGRRQVLVPGLASVVLGGVAFMLASDVYWLAAGRFLTGIGTGMVAGTATAVLVELDPDSNWSRAAVISALALTAGATGGPLASSAALHLALWPLVLPFLLVAVLALAGVAALLLVSWPAQGAQRQHAFRLRDWRPQRPSVPREAATGFLFAGAAGCLAWSAGSLFAALGPSLASDLVGVRDRAVAGLYAAAFQLVCGLGEFVSRRWAVRGMFVSGASVLAVGIVLCVAAMLLAWPLLFALGTAVAAFGSGVAGVGAVALVSRIAPPARRGELISAFYILLYLTMAAVVLSVGFAGDTVGMKSAMVMFGVLTVLAALLLIRASLSTPVERFAPSFGAVDVPAQPPHGAEAAEAKSRGAQ